MFTFVRHKNLKTIKIIKYFPIGNKPVGGSTERKDFP